MITGAVSAIRNADAGVYSFAAIGDYVWRDENNNGIQEVNETGVANVTVELHLASTGALVATTATNTSGYYLFSSVAPATYYVKFLPDSLLYTFSPRNAAGSNVFTDSNANSTGYTSSFTITNGQTDLSIDAGLVPWLCIGKFVWYDINANGIQDEGEVGIPGVIVRLLNASGVLLNTTSTNANGLYQFCNLLPGNYIVTTTTPSPPTQRYSPPVQGNNTCLDSNIVTYYPNGTGVTGTIPVFGESQLCIDIGIYQLSSVGDFVWYDLNGNGLQDNGEAGVGNITVHLYRTADHSLVGTTATNGSGYYHFGGLSPDNYTLQFIVEPTLWLFTQFHAQGGIFSGLDSDVSGLDGSTPSFYLPPSTDRTDLDAGLVPSLGEIGDFVWRDNNGNGIQDNGEPGVANVSVRLIKNNVIILNTTTSSIGLYKFTNITAGTYSVQFVPDFNLYEFSPALQGNNTAVDSNVVDTVNGITLSFSIAANQADYTIDAGLVPLACVGDYVWHDLDADGIQDVNELGIANVTVHLRYVTDPQLPYGAVVASTLTASNGLYLFCGVSPNKTYIVEFVLPNADVWTFSPPGQGSDTNVDSNVVVDLGNGQGFTAPFVPVAGTTVTTYDAGMYLWSTIGTYFWNDVNADGIRGGGESGIANATVLLRNAYNNDTLRASTTDSLGRYLFTKLYPGSYYVQFIIDYQNYLVSPFHALGGIDTLNDSNIQVPDTGRSDLVTLGPEQSKLDVDGGIFLFARLGDYVWIDANANGIQDAGEAPVPNVFVYLRDNQTLELVMITQTDSNGIYHFTKIVPGTYVVQFDVNQTLYTFTTPKLGNNSVDSDVIDKFTGLTGPVTVVAGTTNNDIDAGLWPYSCLGGFVWIDIDADGLFENETIVPGMTVVLKSYNGTNLDVSVTDATGHYEFCQLLTGSYLVEFVSDYNVYIYTKPLIGGNPFVYSSVITSDNAGIGHTGPQNITFPGQNKYDINAGILPFSSIGDYVWLDVNGNGIQEQGEQPLYGVNVLLRNDLDNETLAISQTNVNGLYLFNRLFPGNYHVRFTVDLSLYAYTIPHAPGSSLDNDSDVTNAVTGSTDVIVLPPATPRRDIDAGIIPLSCIGDRVWHDINGNGAQDPNEPSIPNVQVILHTAGGAVVDTMFTDVNGTYTFCSLLAGGYYVEFRLPSNDWTFSPPFNSGNPMTDSDVNSTTPGVGGNTPVINLPNGVTRIDIDAGLVRLGSIGDFVWHDDNGDGVQQPNEAGFGGIPVALYQQLPNGTLVLVTVGLTSPNPTVTNATGYYIFTGVGAACNYVVQFTINSTVYSYSAPGLGGDSEQDSDVTSSTNGVGRTSVFCVSAEQNRRDIDAGVSAFLSIGDYVWIDSNENGLQDPSEIGVLGARVDLYSVNGSLLATTFTDASGYYLFGGLLTATYRVRFFLPGPSDTWTFTIANSNIDPQHNSKVTDFVNGYTDYFTLTTSRYDIDAGVYRFSTIGDYYWVDSNGNGRQETGEPAIAGARVDLYLYDAVGQTFNMLRTTATDSFGLYNFTGLSRGTYQVRFQYDSTQYAFTTYSTTPASNRSAVNAWSGGFGRTADIVISMENTIDLTQDAGLVFIPGRVGDFVWADLDGDSFQDAGEPGIENVTVNLYAGTPANNSGILLTSKTDQNGLYLFNNLSPGTYFVEFLPDTTIWEFSPYVPQNPGMNTAVVDASTGRTAAFTLLPGQSNLNQDAGLQAFASICGVVWIDANQDGQRQSNETVVPGVNVVLGKDGLPYSSVIQTDVNGSYCFTHLKGGNYFVFFAPGYDYSFTVPNVGSDNSDSDVDGSNGAGTTATFTLAFGEDKDHVDAGLIEYNPPPTPGRPSAIGGIAWLDGDCEGTDGVYISDPPAVGVLVQLYFANGTFYAETLTDNKGEYVFNDVPANTNYYVKFAQIPGYVFVPPHAYSPDSIIDSDVTNNSTGTTDNFFVGSYVLVLRQSDAGYLINCDETTECIDCEDLTDVFCHADADNLKMYRLVTKK